MTLKHLVLALAVAAACAVAPSSPRGSEAVGDTFDMGKALAKGRRHADRDRLPQRPQGLPRVRPPHRSRPRFLPQGGDGVDSCTASGSGNSVTGCEP